jgi:hypothetical protein
MITSELSAPVEPAKFVEGPERRAAARFISNRRPVVCILPRPSLQPHSACVHNIAVNSIGLLVGRPFTKETLLAIQLRSAYVGLSTVLSGQVKHATPFGDNTWLLGCTLSRDLTDEELFGLL